MIPRPRFSGSNPIEAFAKARQDIVAPSSSTWTDWTDWTGGTAPKQAMLRHNTCVICHLLPCKCHSICIICPQKCYKCQGACQILNIFQWRHTFIHKLGKSFICASVCPNAGSGQHVDASANTFWMQMSIHMSASMSVPFKTHERVGFRAYSDQVSWGWSMQSCQVAKQILEWRSEHMSAQEPPCMPTNLHRPFIGPYVKQKWIPQ